MSKATTDRFNEIIQWYGWHKKSAKVMRLPAKVELQEKMIDNMFSLMAMMYRDQQKAAMRSLQQQFVLPANMSSGNPAVPFRLKN
jgi:hypothetical protein